MDEWSTCYHKDINAYVTLPRHTVRQRVIIIREGDTKYSMPMRHGGQAHPLLRMAHPLPARQLHGSSDTTSKTPLSRAGVYSHISVRNELCIDKTRDVCNYSKSQNTRPRKVRAPSCSTMHSRVSNIDSIRAPPSGVTHRFISSAKRGSPSTHIHKEVHRLFD